MSRHGILVALLNLSVGGQAVQQVLDLTTVVERGVAQSVVGGYATSSALPVTITITELPEHGQTMESFLFEVSLKNVGSSALTIPWSPDPLWDLNVEHAQRFRAHLSLTIANGAHRGHLVLFSARSMYGRLDVFSSVHVLQPGETARVRATGKWSAFGVNLADYLAESQGTGTVTASFWLERGTDMARAAPSAPRSVTLHAAADAGSALAPVWRAAAGPGNVP